MIGAEFAASIRDDGMAIQTLDMLETGRDIGTMGCGYKVLESTNK